VASVSFRQAEGARTTTRAIQSIGASGFMVVTTGLVTPRIGDIVEIFSGISGNNGFFTIYALSGTTDQWLRPFPNTQGVGGSAARLNRQDARTIGATAVTSVVALSGATNLAVVQVSGANFLTNEINRNDRVALSGATISGNNGGWYVQDVLAEDLLVLRPPDRGAGLASQFPGTGNIEVRRGLHLFSVTLSGNEAFRWSALNVSGLLPASGASLFQGSGELRDYIKQRSVGANTAAPRRLVALEGTSNIQFLCSGLSGLSFESQDEIVCLIRDTLSPSTGGNMTRTALNFNSAGNPASPVRVNLGTNPFGDRYSVVSGSVWVGIQIPANQIGAPALFSLFGSYFDSVSDVLFNMGSTTSGVGSVFRPSLTTQTGSLLESMIVYGTVGLNPQGAADLANVLVGSNTTTGGISTAGATMTGLILASGVLQPMTGTTFATGIAYVVDPRIDFDLSIYFFNLFSGTMEKLYTFNPRFVSLDSPSAAGQPISGLYAELYEVDEFSLAQTLVASGFTGSDGRLNGGAGHLLRRQELDAGEVSNLFFHRLVLQGGGFRLINQAFQLAARAVADITVARIAPDYEGEYDE